MLSRYARTGWKGSNVAAKASKALHIASKVASALNVERKAYDSQQIGIIPVAGPTSYFDISVIPQGVGQFEREGGQVKFTSIQGRLRFSYNSAAAAGQVVRTMLVMDIEGTTGSPALSDLLQNVSIPTESPLLLDNGRRFKVLYDRTCVLDAQTPTAYRKFFIKLRKGIKTRYLNGTTTAATNGLYWVTFCSTNTANNAILEGYIRTRFVDN